MALITQKKGSLSGGVNQQAAEHRLSNQVEEMINCVPSLDRGLLKRNPTTTLALGGSSGASKSLAINNEDWVYEFTRNSGNRFSNFAMVINKSSKTISITDLDSGKLYTVGDGITLSGTASNYLFNAVGDKTRYSATTIKDTTFIVNKNVTPTMYGASGSSYTNEGYIWIKRIDVIDGYEYGCFITLSGVTYNIPLGTRDTSKSSNGVAQNLRSRINSIINGEVPELGSETPYTPKIQVDVSSSIIRLRGINGFTLSAVEAADSYGDTASFGWTYSVDSLSQLPANMSNFRPIVRVGSTGDGYWLQYDGQGWRETYDRAISTTINPSNMPHVLTIAFDPFSGAYFTIKPYTWSQRLAGDDKSNMLPTFLQGNKIKDIFFYRNRMGILTDVSLSLSEVGEYNNFFRTSVAALLDSDRIDTGIESKGSVSLEHALVFDDSVVVFSNQNQYRFEGGDILSPSSFKITEIGQHDIDITIRPVALNNRIYFVSARGGFSAVYELMLSNSSTQSNNATDITAHCQSYLHRNINRLSISPVNSMLFVTSDDGGTVFVYKFYDMGTTRYQSAWFKWSFTAGIQSAFALEDTFYILKAGTSCEKMDIFPQEHSLTFLDRGSVNISSVVDFGEWVIGADNNKEIRGSLLFKTVQISDEDGSEYGLRIQDLNRGTTREVPHKFIKGRKPLIGGNSENIRVSLLANDSRGFRINMISFEGDYYSRSQSK